MPRIQPHEYDPDAWDDQDDYAAFEPVSRPESQPAELSQKEQRRRREREWGRAIHKFQKHRRRQNDKP